MDKKYSMECYVFDNRGRVRRPTLVEGVKKALFTGAALSFVCPELSGSCVRVFEDSQGAIALAANPLSSTRSKRIDVHFHFVGELHDSL